MLPFGAVEASYTVSQEFEREQNTESGCTAYTIEDKDSCAAFDGQQWTVEWC